MPGALLTSPGAFFDVYQKLWHENAVFGEILGCSGRLTSPEKKWVPVAIKIFYKYDMCSRVLVLKLAVKYFFIRK